MRYVTIRDCVLGKGTPKICVPVMPKSYDTIKSEIDTLKGLEYDVVEWRMDHYANIFNLEEATKACQLIRECLGDIPLLATFRTAKEGGEQNGSNEQYAALNKTIIDTKLVDLIDVECFTGEKEVKEIVAYAHQNNVYVVMSNHDFHATPSYDEIVRRLTLMATMGADIPKIALMPQSKADVLTLLAATNEVSTKIEQPIITMSMSSKGMISRLCGEVFGSCLTFGAAAKASAPGQINVQELKTILEIIHKSL